MRKGSRVEQIRKQVREGTYKVDADAVAEAMLELDSGRNRIDADTRSLIRALHYDGTTARDIAKQVGVCEITVSRILRSHCRPGCLQSPR